MKRVEIETTLNESRNWLLATFEQLSDEQLHAPLTRSQHDPEAYWNALDHFAHLALIERDFAHMIRRQLDGESNPVGLLHDDQGEARTREEIMAIVNARTEKFQNEHHHDTLSQVITLTGSARANTLALLAELSDAQLDEVLVGAPWGDGTIGSVLAANAAHADRHWRWATEAGLADPSA